MKVRTGDKVRIIAGKDRGKEGEILQVFVAQQRVVVDGVNMMKRHMKSRGGQKTKGQIIDFPCPIHVSNVVLVSPKTGTTGRVGSKMIEESGTTKKIRVVRKANKQEDIE